MQDKSKNILTDKGWDAMELILDKEMPQKKKRRYLIWWLFGGLLLVSAFLMLQYNFTGNEKSQITAYENANDTPQYKSTKKDVQISATADADLKLKGKTNEIIETAIEPKEIEEKTKRTIIKQSKSVATDAVKVEPQNKIVGKSLPNSSVKKQVDEVINSQKQFFAKNEVNENTQAGSNGGIQNTINQTIIETTKEVASKNEGVYKEEARLKVENLAIKEDSKGSEVEVKSKENLVDITLKQSIEEPLKERLILELGKLSPISIFKELSFNREITLVETKVKKPSYWYGDIAGYLNWGPKDNLYGIDTQVEFGYSFNSNFDLGMSLGVGSFMYAASTNQETAIATSGRTMFSNAEAANVLNSNFSNTSHLDIGVHTGWNITQVIKLKADVGYSYLFSSMFDINNNADGVGLDVFDPSPAGGESLNSEILVEGEKGNLLEFEYKLDRAWFPYAGLSFQLNLNSNLAIDLGYRKVFGELFESSSNPLSMDRARFGIKYRFLKKANKP